MSHPITSLISIVVPAFNAGRFVNRALEGIREQSYPNWEVIVVEDGSNDETEGVVDEFGRSVAQRVTYAKNGSNLGVSATRNRAMSLAQGEVIAFLDADDWWTPEHLAFGLDTLQQATDICFSGFHVYGESVGTVLENVVPTPTQLRHTLVDLFDSNFIQTSSLVMITHRVAGALGGFDTGLKVGEDLDYWIRAIGQGFKLAFTNRTTCYYVKHESSAMAKTLMVAEHMTKFYQKHLKSTFLPQALRRERYANSLLQWGRLIRRNNPRLARSLFLHAWKVQPLNWTYPIYALASLGGSGKKTERSLTHHGDQDF